MTMTCQVAPSWRGHTRTECWCVGAVRFAGGRLLVVVVVVGAAAAAAAVG